MPSLYRGNLFPGFSHLLALLFANSDLAYESGYLAYGQREYTGERRLMRPTNAPSFRYTIRAVPGRKRIEEMRWPDGPVCPICGAPTTYITKSKGVSRKGSYRCRVCGDPFTVTVGTFMDGTHLTLDRWARAISLHFDGVKAKKIMETTGVSYKTARRMHKLISAAHNDGQLKLVNKRIRMFFEPKHPSRFRNK